MPSNLNFLVLGGTVYLGRAVVDAALAGGHQVTVLNRGRSGSPPPGVTTLRADRTVPAELDAALAGTRFDVVVDTSGFDPDTVRESARRLAGVSSYVFVSTVNAYRDWPVAPIPDESAPTYSAGTGYGPGKAAAERALEEVLPGRVLAVRPGVIVGPYDYGGQLPWWIDRISRGGRVVAPGDPDRPIALIDVRDLAQWLVTAGEHGWSGPVNATGRLGHTTMGGLLTACREVTGSDAELAWAPEELLLAHGVSNFLDLPLFAPLAQLPGGFDIGTARARSLGLPSRPVRDTVADIWAWLRTLDGVPYGPGVPVPTFDAEREREVLAALAALR
jgi:2'-hydroxyisoflavone reductase